MSDQGDLSFANHRGVVPLISVFAGLACVELVVVHFVLSQIWPRLAWPVSVLTLASVVWLISWIRSWKRLPHRLRDGRLILHMGSLRKVELDLVNIAKITPVFGQNDAKRRSVLKLVPIVFPNRLLLLKDSVQVSRRQIDAIAIHLDQPEAFDRAMMEQGIKIDH